MQRALLCMMILKLFKPRGNFLLIATIFAIWMSGSKRQQQSLLNAKYAGRLRVMLDEADQRKKSWRVRPCLRT